MPTLTSLPPETALLVSPVHLAGPGDSRLITAPLDASADWDKVTTTTGVHYVSTCQRVHIAHLPDSEHGGWAVRGYRTPSSEAVWGAAFGHGTPAEITAAFTTALVDGLRTNPRYYMNGGVRHPPGSPAAVLADRGWQPTPAKGYHDQVSPDGHAAYRHRLGWHPHEAELEGEVPGSWAMVGGAQRERWKAEFTIGVPFYPLTRAALALSSAEPVRRRLGEIPPRCLPHVTARPATAPAQPRRPAAQRPATPAAPPPAAASAVGARRR
ncbi:DUF317 domain-containing protein [Kitasatospora sp. NBC_01287]|uniref:DUF317 domain-containing protein n=1 Tax=Kitasatospora sp. NBC_01287 TaxID=2903573 RepID=UPI00225228AD|nr:DUF317 domain-containing protein [Kitasatospora sp. NBC_01287]MCX4751243.1 DUF317 domain-containing protein [Kitasatospora sp. NBC_01287]